MDDVKDWRFHLCSLKVLVCAEIKASQGFAEQLRFADIDRDKLEDPILGHDTDNHGTPGLIVNINERYSTCTCF